jgi:carbonic anhydrase
MSYSLMIIFLLFFMSLSACSLQTQTAEPENKLHNNEENYIIPGISHGLIQSPINILSNEKHETKKHQITLHFQDEIKAVENLGHTVQLDFSKGSSISSDGMSYEFKQMHFHTPSEHLIDGMTFPMEMHIVNYVPPATENDTPHYLVIAVLFKMGNENKFISEFLTLIPKQSNNTLKLEKGRVKLHDLFIDDLSNELKSYYHYRGSLTTPPYTETVNWFVLKHIIEASPEQIRAINDIEGDNTRHIQAIYGRQID